MLDFETTSDSIDVQASIEAEVEKRRMAQLISAKKKLKSFRAQKSRNNLPLKPNSSIGGKTGKNSSSIAGHIRGPSGSSLRKEKLDFTIPNEPTYNINNNNDDNTTAPPSAFDFTKDTERPSTYRPAHTRTRSRGSVSFSGAPGWPAFPTGGSLSYSSARPSMAVPPPLDLNTTIPPKRLHAHVRSISQSSSPSPNSYSPKRSPLRSITIQSSSSGESIPSSADKPTKQIRIKSDVENEGKKRRRERGRGMGGSADLRSVGFGSGFSFGKKVEQEEITRPVESPKKEIPLEEDAKMDFELPPMDFTIPSNDIPKNTGFAFPQQNKLKEAFSFPAFRNSPKAEAESTSLTFSFPNAHHEQTITALPQVAVVPSTPHWDDFELPAVDIQQSPSPGDQVKNRLQGFKFGMPKVKAPDTIEEEQNIAGAMPSEPTNSMFGSGLPSLPSTPTRKKRHSHTRSGSVSSYHAFLPHPSVISSGLGPRSPGLLKTDSFSTGGPNRTLSSPSSPDDISRGYSPVKAPGEIKLDRAGALATLEGARNGLVSASAIAGLTWPGHGSGPVADGLFGRDGRRLSATGLGKRRSRKSLMLEQKERESVEVVIPDMGDSDDEDTPKQETANTRISGSTSPLPFELLTPPTKKTRERPLSGSLTFDRMYKNPPPNTPGGFGLSSGPVIGASVEPVLKTLMEEDEPEEEEVFPPERAISPIASTPAKAQGIRPLKMLSMSSDSFSSISSVPVRSFDVDDSHDRRSFSFDRGRSPSIDSAPFSPGSNAASDVSLRRNSLTAKSGDEQTRSSRRRGTLLGWNPRLSGSSLAGSVRTLNEVPESMLLDHSLETPRAGEHILDHHRMSLKSAERTRRRRSRTGQSLALESFADCTDIDFVKERLAEAEMERVAMEQDIQDWRGRCGDLEKQLLAERQQGGILRERVRRLGDHLSQLSSANNPANVSGPEVDTPTQLVASMRDQLFKLAQEVERERKEKAAALANVAGLQNQLGMYSKTDTPPDSHVSVALRSGENSDPLVTDDARKARLDKFSFPIGSVTPFPTSAQPHFDLEPFRLPIQASGTTFHNQAQFTRLDSTFSIPILPDSAGMNACPGLDFRRMCHACRGDLLEL